jgi:hypothetical protein
MRRACVAAASFAAFVSVTQGGPAAAAETRYTELVGGRCRFISDDRQTGEDALKRCPGHGGAELETFASHTRASLSVRFSRKQRVADVVAGWSLGRRVEWRGAVTNKGFEPHAAIVRVLFKDHERPTPQADGQVLAVLRIDPREAEACAAAYVDARANKNANRLARDTADRMAPTFLCDSDKPAVVGAATRWTSAALRKE